LKRVGHGARAGARSTGRRGIGSQFQLKIKGRRDVRSEFKNETCDADGLLIVFNQPKLVCFGCLTLDDIVPPGKPRAKRRLAAMPYMEFSPRAFSSRNRRWWPR
jgi:hypothetical protein